jgi:hypothetical protein
VFIAHALECLQAALTGSFCHHVNDILAELIARAIDIRVGECSEFVEKSNSRYQ